MKTKLNELNDDKLVALCQKGNNEAKGIIYKKYYSRLYGKIFLSLKNHEETKDLLQEVFLKIFAELEKGTYEEKQMFFNWAIRVAYYKMIDFVREKKRNRFENLSLVDAEGTDLILDVTASSDTENAEEVMIREENLGILLTLMDFLIPEQKEVLILRYYANMSFKEIAILTRVPLFTAISRASYARRNLRKIIEDKNARAVLETG